MKLRLSAFCTLCILLYLGSCKTVPADSAITTVRIENPSSGFYLSDIFSLKGFTALKTENMKGIDRFHGISKLLFSDNKIIVFDNESDFQNIWFFDAVTGELLGKIDHQMYDKEISDIDLNKNGEISALVAGKRSFFNYSTEGRLLSTVPNGVIGDKIVCLEDGARLVYNEYSATDISGYHQLLLFDKKGNLQSRIYPYPPGIDNFAYTLSGFISKSDNTVWFAPPFCDTVYEVAGKKLTPRYTFDFGRDAVPEALRSQKISGWDVHQNAYLSEDFVKTGHFLIFDYFKNQKMNIGLFDEKNMQFYKTKDASKYYLYGLLGYGRLFPKDDHTLAFLLTGPQLKYLFEQNAIDLEATGREHPALYRVLSEVKETGKSEPLILYLSVKTPTGDVSLNVQK